MSVKVESGVPCRDNSGSNMTVVLTATNWSWKLAFMPPLQLAQHARRHGSPDLVCAYRLCSPHC